MDYDIEIRIASKNGWFTPDESQGWYSRYSRDGVAVHWWGDGTGADNHDNIVNYILNQASLGNKSANYVVSDNKITMLVNPDNVAFCTFSANAYSISIEHQPTLGTEGYKKSGWLVWQLRQRYNKNLWVNGHSQLVGGTACPGTIDMGRIEAEAQKWASGGYNPTPAPTPPPPAEHADLEWQILPEPVNYITNKQPTNLWNFNQTKWSGFGDPVKQFAQGENFTAAARVINHTLGAHYMVTQFSVDKHITNGVNEADLAQLQQPTPSPVPPNPVPEPLPVPPTDTPAPTPTPPDPTPEPTPPIQPPDPTPTPPTSTYPNWFVEFWVMVFQSIKNILGIK